MKKMRRWRSSLKKIQATTKMKMTTLWRMMEILSTRNSMTKTSEMRSNFLSRAVAYQRGNRVEIKHKLAILQRLPPYQVLDKLPFRRIKSNSSTFNLWTMKIAVKNTCKLVSRARIADKMRGKIRIKTWHLRPLTEFNSNSLNFTLEIRKGMRETSLLMMRKESSKLFISNNSRVRILTTLIRMRKRRCQIMKAVQLKTFKQLEWMKTGLMFKVKTWMKRESLRFHRFIRVHKKDIVKLLLLLYRRSTHPSCQQTQRYKWRCPRISLPQSLRRLPLLSSSPKRMTINQDSRPRNLKITSTMNKAGSTSPLKIIRDRKLIRTWLVSDLS